MNYSVTADLLNLRSSPVVDPENVLLLLKHQDVVTGLDTSNPTFYKVETINEQPPVIGFVAAAYLKPVTDNVTTGGTIPYLQPVNLQPNAESRRDNHAAWQYPLGESNMPTTDSAIDVSSRIASMQQIVAWLAVDKSVRYRRDLHTYCNIYAYDYCYLSGAFLPRVWWTAKSLISLSGGASLAPIYDRTVVEVSANGLFAWLEQWGSDYRWVRTYSLDDLQQQANQGRVGVICAANINPSKSGHICCVLPESDSHSATRKNGLVTCPLLSQAGAINLQYYSNNPWWVTLAKEFKGFGFWYKVT